MNITEWTGRQGRRPPRSAAEAKTALFARRSPSRAGRAGGRHGEGGPN